MSRIENTKERLQKKLIASQKTKYMENYKLGDINMFADDMVELFFGDGKKKPTMMKLLESHNRDTEAIIFQKLHPDDYLPEFESYLHQSIKLVDFFALNDEFIEKNDELFVAKEKHNQSCLNGNPLLFFIFLYPKIDHKEISDMEFVLCDNI